MMLRFSLNQEEAASRIERAVQAVLEQGLHARHLQRRHQKVGTVEMGEAVLAALKAQG